MLPLPRRDLPLTICPTPTVLPTDLQKQVTHSIVGTLHQMALEQTMQKVQTIALHQQQVKMQLQHSNLNLFFILQILQIKVHYSHLLHQM